MGITDGIKHALIRTFNDKDIELVLEKINELSQRRELVLRVQRESGKIENIKIIDWILVEHE